MGVSLTNKATGEKYTSSPNPVIREFYGETAKERAAAQAQIISKAKAAAHGNSGKPGQAVSKNAATLYLTGETARKRAESQQQIISKTKAAAPSVPQQQEKQEDPGLLSRTGNTVTGAAKSSASSFANLGGVILEGLGKLGSFLQDKKDAKQAAQDREYLAQHEKELAEALAAGDEEAAKWAQIKINQAKYRLKTNGDLGDYYDSVTEETVRDVYGKADELAASAATDIEEAKKGLGSVGKFAVDAGVAGTQLAGDVGLAVLTGGTALVPMAARSFGGAAQEARQSGADFGQQVAYGAGSAALGVLTEKIANVAGPFKKAFGSGVVDNLAPNLTKRLTQTATGKLALSALSEGGEEFVEAVFQPVLQQATYNRDASFDLEQALYEAAIGAALGVVGGGADVATGGKTTQNPAGKAAGTQAVSSEGKFTPAKQMPVQAVSGGVLEQEAQRLYAKENPPAQGTGYAATDLGRPSAPLGVSATQKDNTSVAPSAGNASENVDPLLKLLTGGKRVDQTTSSKATAKDPLLKILLETQENTTAEDTIPINGTEGRRVFPGINRVFEHGSTSTGQAESNNDPTASPPVGEAAHNTYRDGPGAADAGYTAYGTEGQERTSRTANSNPYNDYQEAATGMTKEEYDRIFRYESQTEERSMRLAEEMLYMIKDGRRTFLKDIDSLSFSELVRSLDEATAWNGPQMDAAHMIQTELQGRSVNGEITSEEYVNWLRIMREHETATGQGVQANAKWSRTDNHGGNATEMEAWEDLEQSNLSDKEKAETFRRIVQWDMEIEASTDTAGLKDIILQVAEQRGVIGGPFGAAFRKVADSTLDSLTFEQLKQFAYASTSALSKDHIPANWGQKLKTIQVLNMLSSPKTAIKNLVGNTSFYGIDALAMDGAAILDMALSRVTGTRSVAMERAVLGRTAQKDAVKAMQMAIAEITLDVDMSSAESRYGTGSNRTFKVSGRGAFNTGLSADRFLERTLSAIERNQAYLLTATDEFYKGAARGTQRSTQKLVDSGKIKTADKDYAAKQAEQLSKYRTFQDDSKLSVATQQIHDVLNLVGIGDSGKTIKGKTVHAFGAGDIAAPFTRVAANIVSRGVEYSPVNAVKGTLEILQQVAKSVGGQNIDPTVQAKGVSDLARGMTGTAIAYGFMLLAKEGLLRQADDEEDPDVAAMNQSEGITGTQINISAAERALAGDGTEWRTGDTLVDLSSIEPLNFLINLGVELAKEDSNPLVSTFNATTNSAMSAATELPVLESAGNFAEDVFKYGADPKESLAQEAANTLISSVVPNVVAGVAKGLDDRPRNTYAGDDLWSIIQASFKNRIPGLRETLPGSVNSIGEEKLYQGSEDALLAALLSPVKINTYSQSDISKEMARVREATGDPSFYPSKSIPKELSYTDENGKKHIASLDYEQRQDFQRDRNTLAIITGTNVMASAAYKNATATKQAELLDDANSYAYEVAKANVMGSDSVSAWVNKTMDATRATGLNPATVIVYRDKLSTEKQKEQTTAQANKAVRNAIMADSSLTTAQKNALDNIVISDGVYIPKDVEVDYSSTEIFTISQMSEGAQKRWNSIKSQFDMDADTYATAWSIYQNDDLTAAQKRQQLSSLGYNGSALYTALGKKLG